MDPCDTIADFQNCTHFADIDLTFKLRNLLLYDGGNFVSTDLHRFPLFLSPQLKRYILKAFVFVSC